MLSLSKLYELMKTPGSIIRSAAVSALLAAFILLVPLAAMQFTPEIKWSLFDFIAAWILLFSAGFGYKLVVRKIGSNAYRLAVGTAAFTGLFLVWSNLAVGIIGSENNPANLMYFGVLGVLVIGILITGFQPQRMLRILIATAVAQMLTALIALSAGKQLTQNSPAVEILGVNLFFALMWIVSALLFKYAGQKNAITSQS